VPERPSVLIVGGFMTAPPNYLPLRRRLLARGAARVDVAPLWPPDWMIAGTLGFGPLLRRTGRAIVNTWRLGGRAPIIVIGHSGGGIAARLAMSPVPFHGRVAAVAGAVGCLVTLGTPHRLFALGNRYHHAGHVAAAFLEQETPGAFFAPRTAYLTVGSNFVDAGYGGPVGRALEEVFSVVVGHDTAIAGDGIVPAAAVHLDGAEQLTFDDVRHGFLGRSWYGAAGVVDRWWPRAVELWQQALAERERAAAGSSASASKRVLA
jgi:hypothetical protein